MRNIGYPLIVGLALLSLTGLLGAGCEQKSLLSRIQDHGELLIATRNSPTSYYEGPDGPAGLEYELVKRFAERLGVTPVFVFPQPFEEVLNSVRDGRVHMAAAGLTVTRAREKSLRFSLPYQHITEQLVYRRGSTRPRDLSELDGSLEVMRGTSHEERLTELRDTRYPDLAWVASQEYENEELLYLVEEQAIDYTVADSNELALNQRYFPHIKAAFALTDPEPLAWAFARWPDGSLARAANAFMLDIKRDGTLARLLKRHYGREERINFVDRRVFWRHVESRLPRYLGWFQQAADTHDLDWRLLAAVGYQESHWNPRARSPTGVRGLMMLTLVTAKRVGIKNRLDPRQSIVGGARYLRMLEQSIPERIPEPDRTWLALAGYNVGFGHLEDARILTERQGGDPDKWAEVKQRLPLLSRKQYYSKLKHGYARGREPVFYVDNIRSYYDLLVWHTNTQRRDEVRERVSEAQDAGAVQAELQQAALEARPEGE
jgi:membrane-bound lytic murein transglycosylase F